MERLSDKLACVIEECIKAWSQVEEDIVEAAINRPAAYEDTGPEPEEIKTCMEELTDYRESGAGPFLCKCMKEFIDKLGGSSQEHILDLLQAEKDGRLFVPPFKNGDTVYVIGECRIMECFIDETYLDDRKGIEYLVSFDCDNNCEGCPFNDWHQDYSGEYSCNGEYGQVSVVAADFGKTVFLTREEAEAALAKKGGGE